MENKFKNSDTYQQREERHRRCEEHANDHAREGSIPRTH